MVKKSGGVQSMQGPKVVFKVFSDRWKVDQ